jgi:hypothetical protein
MRTRESTRSRAPGLGLDYECDGTTLLFEDGVVYTVKEALLLCGADADAQRAVHAAKSVFKGEVIGSGPVCDGLCRHPSAIYGPHLHMRGCHACRPERAAPGHGGAYTVQAKHRQRPRRGLAGKEEL